MHEYQDLINIFNQCFSEVYNTRLIKGDEEPIYLPADEHCPYHSIIFAHGFFASALHECAHWLIAGEARRKLVDFGYWYVPDGRTSLEQELFQKVEVKPQAIEWILSKAAGFKFYISADNLNGSGGDPSAFKRAVYEQVKTYCEKGLPERAESFRRAIGQFYSLSPVLKIEDFTFEELN